MPKHLFTVILRNRFISVAFYDAHGETDDVFSFKTSLTMSLPQTGTSRVSTYTDESPSPKGLIVRARGVKSRMCPPYPQGVVKGDLLGRRVGITVYKGWSRVGAWMGTLKNPTKCLWRSEPDRRSNYFFSPPAHLHVCAVTCVTEISLIVTLNNQFTSNHLHLKASCILHHVYALL